MKKIKTIAILGLVFFGIVWFFPVKTITLCKNAYIEKNLIQNKTVVVCHVAQVTGPLWRICEVHGTNFAKDDYVDIIGNIPENFLKYPIYSYDADFIFVGAFDESGNFISENWEVCGPIWRGGTYKHPFYPLYGFNLFEVNFMGC